MSRADPLSTHFAPPRLHTSLFTGVRGRGRTPWHAARRAYDASGIPRVARKAGASTTRVSFMQG
eukprot:6062021-Prymnesium_polylepis.1